MDSQRHRLEVGGVLAWTWFVTMFLLQLAQFIVLQSVLRSLTVY